MQRHRLNLSFPIRLREHRPGSRRSNGLVHPSAPTHLVAAALAGVIGDGNLIASRVRLTAVRRLDSTAVIADGHHGRADTHV